jgi:hypothetical protein
MADGDNYVLIGEIGAANMILLSLSVLWRIYTYLINIDFENKPKDFYKKMIFYTVLCLAPIMDLPMYLGNIYLSLISLFIF